MSASEKLISNLVNLREENNWTQAELARRVNMDSSYISKIESGARKVSSNELARFAEVFHVTTDYLLGRPEQSTEELENIDLEQALDNAHSFSGKPLSERDRKVAKDVLRSLFQD